MPGVTLAADVVGDGHPVVLLHAGIADRRMWRAQVPALAAAGHRVLALDLPGCGESGVPDAGFVLHEPVAETLAAHDVARATLVGCSFGGRIALDLTLARPDLVDGLVLFGPALGGHPTAPDLRSALQEATHGIAEDDLDALAVAETLFWVVGVDRPATAVDPEILRLVEQMNRRDLDGEVALERLEITELDPPAAGRLGEIAVPAVVTTGAHDHPAVRRTADHIAASIPAGRRLPDIPAAGHLPSLDAPEAVTRILLDALRDR